MWKSNVGRTTAVNLVKPVVNTKDDDDWETDADFVNDVSEREQRWGAKTVEGSGRLDAIK
jgi:cortactin